MSQIFWMFSLIPDSWLLAIINIVLVAGLIGTVVSFFFMRWFPVISNYKTLAQIISVIVLTGGVYFKGGFAIEMEWRAKVAALQAKVALAEEKSKTVNAEIQTKIVTRTKVIHDTKIVTKEVLKEHTVMIDKECSVPDVITVLNKAATRPPLNLELPKEVVK